MGVLCYPLMKCKQDEEHGIFTKSFKTTEGTKIDRRMVKIDRPFFPLSSFQEFVEVVANIVCGHIGAKTLPHGQHQPELCAKC